MYEKSLSRKYIGVYHHSSIPSQYPISQQSVTRRLLVWVIYSIHSTVRYRLRRAYYIHVIVYDTVKVNNTVRFPVLLL